MHSVLYECMYVINLCLLFFFLDPDKKILRYSEPRIKIEKKKFSNTGNCCLKNNSENNHHKKNMRKKCYLNDLPPSVDTDSKMLDITFM